LLFGLGLWYGAVREVVIVMIVMIVHDLASCASASTRLTSFGFMHGFTVAKNVCYACSLDQPQGLELMVNTITRGSIVSLPFRMDHLFNSTVLARYDATIYS
jgi:hypothetical protein